jgi:hypothetical protein
MAGRKGKSVWLATGRTLTLPLGRGCALFWLSIEVTGKLERPNSGSSHRMRSESPPSQTSRILSAVTVPRSTQKLRWWMSGAVQTKTTIASLCRGKIVLTSGDPLLIVDRAVYKHGAAGIVSCWTILAWDRLNQLPADNVDLVGWGYLPDRVNKPHGSSPL